MAQGPFQVDALRIEDAQAGTREIARDASDGSMTFKDSIQTTPIKLTELAGLQTIASVMVVGTSGAGARYTAIQDAIDAIPNAASSTNPYFVLVMPGVYAEEVTINKDGVFLFSFGATITSAAASTVEIVASVGATPQRIVMRGFRIINTGVGNACLTITGGAGSNVGLERIDIIDCDLVASGVGGFQIDAQDSNLISVSGGSWSGSNATSICRVQQCADFFLAGVDDVKLLQMDYDTGGTIPATAGSSYRLSNLVSFGNMQSTLIGAGSVLMSNCIGTGNLTFNGDRSANIYGSKLGTLTINNTFAVVLKNSTRGVGAGAGTLAESMLRGSQVFVASALENITFDVQMPDTNYVVALEYEVNSLANVSNKAVTGFSISFGGNQNTTVYYTVMRE